MAQSVQSFVQSVQRPANGSDRGSYLAAVGEEIRRERLALRLGQRELAAKAGVALGTLSAIENGLCDSEDSIMCVRLALVAEISGTLRLISGMAADALARLSKGLAA